MDKSRRNFLQTLGVSAAAWPLAQLAVPTTATGASPEPLVASVRDLGVQFRGNRVNVTGQDAAASLVLPTGESLWVFGDTVEGPFETIRNLDLTNLLSNTGAIVPPQDVSQGIKQFDYLASADGKRPRQLVPFVAGEDPARNRLWPIHGACVGDEVYLFYHKITTDPEVDVFENFTIVGMGVARAPAGKLEFERLTAPDGTMEFWKGDQPGFGVFVQQLPDGYIYLCGCYWTGMFLARTRPETIANLASYEYLVEAPMPAAPGIEPRWDKQFSPTAVLFDSVPNEMSAAYNPYLERYVAIHVYNRENKLALRTALNITGPWSEPEVFFQPAKIKDSDLFTAGKEHPELQAEGGKVMYVTYVNSSVYMPHLIEVTLQ